MSHAEGASEDAADSARQERVPTTVAVLGSCITRDNFNTRFNPTYKQWYSCPLHQNQSSMIALMSEPVTVAWEPTKEMGEYDRWNVDSDLTRSFLAEVVVLQPDYLILDFFGDVHFGVVQLDTGEFLTDNRWKTQHTTFYREMDAAGRLRKLNIFSDTEPYLALWREAVDRFAGFAREHLPNTTLIIHRGQNTGMLELPGEPRPVSLQKHRNRAPLDVPRSNELWRELDEYAASALAAEVIDLSDTAYATYDDHPWGAFYVHYTMDYYHRFLAELHRIHLAEFADPTVAAMVAEITAAGVERVDRLTTSSDEVIARRDRRIERQTARIERQAARIERQAARVAELEARVEQAERRPLARIRSGVGRRLPWRVRD